MVEISPAGNRWDAVLHVGGALGAPGYLLKGMWLWLRLRSAGVTLFSGTTDLLIEGDDRARVVVFKARGNEHRMAIDTVLLHHGVVSNTQQFAQDHLCQPDPGAS